MIAMAPRAAGSVGHVPHAGGAAARLSGGISGAGNRGARLPHAQQTRTWPRASALLWHAWGGYFRRISRALRIVCRDKGTELLWSTKTLCLRPDKSVPGSGS